MLQEHETVRGTIEFDVDEGIALLVKFINSINGLYTIFSCEGDENGRAYVSFHALHQESLAQLSKELNLLTASLGVLLPLTLDVSYYQGHLRYSWYVDDADLNLINERLEDAGY